MKLKLLLICAVATAAFAADGDLLGRWSTSHISMIQYQDRATGRAAPTNGTTFAYEFRSDGTYSFTGLAQFVSYNCTTSTFSNEAGTYTLEGDRVSLNPQSNPYRMTNNCAPSSNREAPGKLLPRTYRFHVDSQGLELTGGNGAAQRFHRE